MGKGEGLDDRTTYDDTTWPVEKSRRLHMRSRTETTFERPATVLSGTNAWRVLIGPLMKLVSPANAPCTHVCARIVQYTLSAGFAATARTMYVGSMYLTIDRTRVTHQIEWGCHALRCNCTALHCTVLYCTVIV